MKKVLIFLLLLVTSFSFVDAKENRLYFTENNNHIYYESDLLDEKVFLKHTDMVPGESYTDELIIENGTNTKYTLYLKAVPREQIPVAENLLECILMKITLDGNVVYEGRATGLDYTDQGVDLQDAVLLGDFTSTKKSKMVVETKLQEEYDDIENREISYIDWVFYAQYDDSKPVEIIESPDTMMNSFPYTIVISGIMILIGFIIIENARKKEN